MAAEAVEVMLLEQDIDRTADALLNSAGFTTSIDMLEQMVEEIDTDAEFARLVESLTQDAGRAAESVEIASRPRVGHVRHLNLPSCSRCVVLAGRVYRYSTGFLRHPGCDCVMIPTTLANDELTYDPVELARTGQVRGLSKADLRAVTRDGADLAKIVNVRRSAAGLTESGRILARNGRMTPEGIYRAAGDDREVALALLKANGYLT